MTSHLDPGIEVAGTWWQVTRRTTAVIRPRKETDVGPSEQCPVVEIVDAAGNVPHGEAEIELVRQMLGQDAGDEQDQDIVLVLGESRASSLAEFLQLVTEAMWEEPDFGIDDQERGDVINLFAF